MGTLTALANKNHSVAMPGKAVLGMGRPDEMPLNKIHPDPNNLRGAEDENTSEGIEEQRELTADIKKRGVKSPISLRPHPEIKGEYMINFGHRRFKGACDAGLATIPYFIDLRFDSYDQVKENLLHRKPSIWALAAFIDRKLKVDGQSMEQIAEGLGKESHSYVSEHLALVDPPECLHQAYAKGVTSPRTLYDLKRAYEEFPEQVEAWCESGTKITRTTIQELFQSLRNERDAVTASQTEGPATAYGCRHDDKIESGTELLHHGKSKPGHNETMRDVVPQRRAPSSPLCEILVQYRGKLAKFAPNATVMIVVAGHVLPLEVPLSELEWEGLK